MATLYEYYNTGDVDRASMYANRWYAQTFTPAISHKITSVKLLSFRAGSPGTVTVSIQGVDGSDHPDGSDLCSGTTDGDTLPTGSPYEWREITLGAGAELTANTKYAIVVRSAGADTSNDFNWRRDTSSPTYEGGCEEFSTNAGSSWTSYTGRDFMFEDWGDPLGVTHELAGVIAGVAGVSATLTNTKWLAGISSGVASVSGAIARTLVLAGVSSGVASVSGAIARTLALAGASAGVCSASAALINQKWLAGIATGRATVIGILTNQKWLAGVIAGKAVVSASLINIKWLAGVIAGVATASANLFHVRVAIRVLSAVRNLLALRNIPPVR